MGRTPRVTFLEVTIIAVAIFTFGGMALANLITTTTTQTVDAFDADIDFRSKNLYNLMRRDILLASTMESGFDSLQTIEVLGDTLAVRFSDLDYIRYFLDGSNIYREDVLIASDILSFAVTNDTVSIHVTIDVAAQHVHRWVNDGNVHHRQYEWVMILNNSQF